MKKFHITWFLDDKKTILTGLTVEAEDVLSAISIAKERDVIVEKIKYIIEL